MVKNRGLPLQSLRLEALLRRLPEHHAKKDQIFQDLMKWQAGYRGERSVDYVLSEFVRTSSHYFALQDLRLQGERQRFFQMDTLLLSSQFGLILEVKNYQGTIHFDGNLQQFRRVHNGKQESFANPLLQVQRQQVQLDHWLHRHHFPPLPIIPFVVLSSPYTTIAPSVSQSGLPKSLLRAEALPQVLLELEQNSKHSWLSGGELAKLSSLLLHSHTPDSFSILKRYKLTNHDIRAGVHCPSCQELPMFRRLYSGIWECRHCSFTSNRAYVESLQDYSLLVNHTVTNGEARRFLGIECRKAMHYLLSQLKLKQEGNSRIRRYLLPPPHHVPRH
ncbi:NERD domain-containing protein [Shouchella shacheensis]|uniref:NERD domain-containing protein n=1 Tax=Shouchella shacheensis TaxID=1649580 RepID=UPI000A83CB1C|nr:NERD domain-containing protein [Shouchella shacheensis]